MVTQHTEVRGPLPITPAEPERRAGTMGYWVGAAIAVVGLIVGLAWGFATYQSYRDQIDRFARTTGPGTETLTLATAGDRTLYYEGPDDPTLELLNVQLVAPDGSHVAINDYVGDLRYDAPDGTVGHAVGTFTAPTVGAYELTAAGGMDQRAHLAIGEGISASTVASILGALFVVAATFCVGLVFVIVTGVRRSRS